MLRSPWLGLLAIVIAGVVGYALSDQQAGETLESITVTVKPARETGGAWDFGGGLPDPEVRIEQAGRVLAKCEAKDTLKITCAVNATIDRAAVRVIVVDVDSSDHDTIGETALERAAGGIESLEATTSGGSPWRRFRALWIALAAGLAIAGALAAYRRRVQP